MKIYRLFPLLSAGLQAASLLAACLLTACAAQLTPINPTPIAPTSTASIAAPTLTPAPSPTAALDCQPTFERREMHEPYQRQYEGQVRYTLSTVELQAYLDMMGIAALCIPSELGAPYLNVDWDGAQNPAVTGRMISIGFENLYGGAGWGDAYLLYSTYDISVPTEFDRFATAEDWSQTQTGAAEGAFRSVNLRGLRRVAYSLWSFETTAFYQTYVYPGQESYVALVVKLGDFSGEIEPQLEQLQAGDLLEETRPWVTLFDRIALTVEGE